MRYNTLRNGNRGAVTPAQLSRSRRGAGGINSTPSSNLRKYVFTRVTADYTADGALFYITMDHGIHSPHYLWGVIKTDNNADVIVEYFNQGDDILTLWFTDNSLSLAITIIG